MGSAPAPHLANGWLSQFDKQIQGESSFYNRYIDDIITIVKKNQIDKKFDTINNFHPSLTFTVEKEQNGCLPFLDMSIYNENGILSSGWFRKPTDTGLTLNYHSLAPFKYKKSVIIGFVHRVYRSCSNWELFHKGWEEAKLILLNNQYPLKLIESIFHETLTRILAPECVEADEEMENMELDDNAFVINVPDKEKFNFFINYRGKLSDKFAYSLKKLNAPCKIIMTLHKTKNVISNLKTPVPKMLKSNVVYQIKCSRCNACYVGQTIRHVQTRFREHIGARGLLKKHFDDCGILPHDNMVTILGRAQGEKLLTLEALFISEIKPSINTKDEYKSRELKIKF